MENKKKAKVDYAAIIREFEMYGRGRSLKQFCDDSSYVYPNVLRYYRKCFWNSKSKLAASPNGDKSLVPFGSKCPLSFFKCGLLQARRTDHACGCSFYPDIQYRLDAHIVQQWDGVVTLRDKCK